MAPMNWTKRLALGSAALVVASQWALAAPPSPKAIELFRNRQYNDAITVLTQEVAGKPEAECGKSYLILGECYFLTRQYDSARQNYTKAKKNAADDGDRLTAEYRLACVAFRQGDAGAAQMIDAFAGDHPKDQRVGRLMVYRLLIATAKGKSAEAEVEALHKKVYENLSTWGRNIGSEADEVLCEYYRKIGSPDKATGLYTRLAMDLARQINDRRHKGEAIPKSMERAHDSAALQLGVLALEQKNRSEAQKWLDTVRYDVEMKTKAQLFLAKLAYEAGDFSAVTRRIGDPTFLEALPGGALRSDVYLLLGLAEKANPSGNPAKVETYLREVSASGRGYAQAQVTIADMYREKGLDAEAIKAYKNAAGNPEYADQALFWIGALNIKLGEKDPVKARPQLQAAADAFRQLVTRHPASPYIKQVKDKAQILAARGIDVQFALADEENAKQWERLANERPGTAEAAQALINLVRQHARRVGEGKKLVKVPDWGSAAAAAEKLLNNKVYTGAGLDAESWKFIEGEAALIRGRAELASIGNPDLTQGRYLKGATAEKALEFLRRAQGCFAGGKPPELAKAVEIGLLEAQFKSSQKENRDAALRGLSDMAERYGSDARFQQLGLEIADWSHGQGLFVDAAKQYTIVAEHLNTKDAGTELIKLWCQIGKLWSKAGRDAAGKQGETTFNVLVYPKETVQLGDTFVKTYRPLQRTLAMKWPSGSPTAREALEALSKATGMPFVWDKALDAPFTNRRITVADGPTTPAAVLTKVLEEPIRAEIAGGLSDGTPTLATPGVDPDDLEGAKYKTIELYDARTAHLRFGPLTAKLGELGANPTLYRVIERIEQAAQTRINWAEGIDKQRKLEQDVRLPGVSRKSSLAETLAVALDSVGLKYRLVRVDVAPQYFENAYRAFNQVVKLGPGSQQGEEALIALAVNYHYVRDYDKMKTVLRQYLKMFDATTSVNYQQACFWVGWAFENEKNYREATSYYARAAEERLVLTKRPDPAVKVDRKALRALLAHDTQISLLEPISGELKEADVDVFAEFVRTKGHVSVRVEKDAQLVSRTFAAAAFQKKPLFDVLCDGLDDLGLTFKVENLAPDTAEKAYFRMATVFQKDEASDQAADACNLLLTRYPNSARRRDASMLLIDIYRNLRQYAKVMSTLEQLRASATDPVERRRLDLEIALMYFDMAAYEKAGDAFKVCLNNAQDANEKLAAREAYARTLFRLGNLDDAHSQYAQLVKDATSDLRKNAYQLMLFTLDVLRGKANERQYPVDAQRWIVGWESLDDAGRAKRPVSDYYKATWIYYTQGLIEQHMQRSSEAVAKFQAVTSSPDENIAADAGYRVATIQVAGGDTKKARDALEFVLLASRSSESTVRAVFALAQVLEAAGQAERAGERYRQVIERYPLSPLVAQAKARLEALQNKAATTGTQPVSN